MKHKTRKFTSLALALALALSLVPALGTTVRADGDHDHTGWTEWTSTDSLPTTAGSYYLTVDVTLNSQWVVPTGATTNLCLNGHGIKFSSELDHVIHVQGGGSETTLNLYDCDTTTTHKYTITDGLATVNDSTGDTPFTGGYITGNMRGGVYVASAATDSSIKGIFKMYGGTILGNAGGVTSTGGGTFELHGGTITGNMAEIGGGVKVDSGGSFTMTGGSITKNTARTTTTDYGNGDVYTFGGNGGGVYVSSKCAFTMSGGSITSNQADESGGGVYVDGGSSYGSYSPARLNISGNATISGNTDGTTTPANSDVFLGKDRYGSESTYDAVITLTAALTGTTPIGVTLASGHNGVFTSGWSSKMSEKSPSDYFTSDNSSYSVTTEGDELKLASSPVASVTADSTTTEYTSLSDAVSAWDTAGAGATLKLLADVTTEEPIKVTGGTREGSTKNPLILDLNGYGIRMAGSGCVIDVEDGILRINDSANSEAPAKHYITLENWRGAAVSESGSANLTDIANGNGVVEITGGYITGGTGYEVKDEESGKTYTLGGGVSIGGGNVTMYGGNIIGNTAAVGGGVSVDGTFNDDAFTMQNGSVSYNRATDSEDGGGGVYVAYGAFNLYGGEVSHNSAVEKGGGVQNYGLVQMMLDGSITDNTAALGGGVYNDDNDEITTAEFGRFFMSGGSITNNTASVSGGGVYNAKDFRIFDTVKITGNKKGDDDNNMAGESITVQSTLNTASRIGVSYDPGVVFTGGLTEKGGITTEADARNIFISDVDGRLIRYLDGEARVKAEQTSAPGDIIIQNISSKSVILTGVEGEEYVIAPKGATDPDWTAAEAAEYNSVSFYNLNEAMEYTVFARVAETDNYLAGTAVKTANATTYVGSYGYYGEALVGGTVSAAIDEEYDKTDVTYQWYLDGTAIGGATSASYVVQESDVEKTLSVRPFKNGAPLWGEAYEVEEPHYGAVNFYKEYKEYPDEPELIQSVGNLKYGDTVQAPDAPTRSGYSFAGWTDGDADVTFPMTVEYSTDVYAKWTARSSGPSTPSTPTTTVTIPVFGDDETVNVTVQIKGDTATVTSTDVDKVLEAEDVGTVTIDVSTLNNNVTEVVLPGAMVEKIADAVADEESNADGMEIKLPTGTVTFDADAVATIAEQANGKDLTLNLDDVKVTELSGDQQEAVKELEVEVVLDAYLTSNGQRISDFGGGKATVSVPYELKDNQTAQGLVVWYVADDGTKTQVPATYDGKNIVFTVTHFSNYVVAYDAEKAAACPQDDTCPLSAFTDLNPSLWYHDGIHFCLVSGMMNGVGKDKFDPNGTTSRAMIVTILYRLENKPEATAENPFDDVDADKWYTDAVIWAAENKIVDGYGDGKFGPNDAITREQLATILYRYAQSKGQGFTGEWMFLLDYPDASEVSEWADEAMHWMVMNGVINGKDGKLVPKGNASRAEAATMLMRYCTEIAK